MTHDYKRNGTIDLFAALNVGTGEVLHQTRRRHTANDVLAFFRWIDLHVPRDLEIHVVLDNLSAHSAPPVAEWLAHPKRHRWHLHFTPTSSSWLNLVEGWFAQLTNQRLTQRQLQQRRRAHRRHRAVGLTLERRPQALRLAHPGQEDHRQGPSEDEPPSPTRSNPRRTTRQHWNGPPIRV